MITRRIFLAGSAAAVAAAARANDWPVRTVKVIVPYLAGGLTDATARVACEHLSNMYPQRFIVENRVGAGGNIAAEYVIRTNDDHILMFAAATQVVLAPLLQKLAYNPRENLKPIARLFQSAYVLCCNSSLGVSTLPELIEVLRKSPGKYNYGSIGVGSSNHLLTEMIRNRAGIEITHVPYTGFSPLMTDLLSDRIQVYFGNYSDLAPRAESGELKILAVSSPARLPHMPDVPTVSETYPGIALNFWNGFMGPPAMSPDLRGSLAASLQTIVAKPSVIEVFTKLGIQPIADTPAAFSAQLVEEENIFIPAVAVAKLAPA